MTKRYTIYILTNETKTVLYIGMTSDLLGRLYQHKEKFVKGFTEKYNADKLVYYEIYDDPYQAVTRERQLKEWQREWKENLINKTNPNWDDLFNQIKG